MPEPKSAAKNTAKRIGKAAHAAAKGAKIASIPYRVKVHPSRVNIMIGKTPIIRFDRPHGKVKFPHININPKISGRPDPHFPVPASVISGAETAAKVIHTVNRVVLPAAIAIDTIRMAASIYQDGRRRSVPKRSIKCAASIVGGWGVGFEGASLGAALETAIFPGVGTLIGGIVGGVVGGIAGAIGAEAAADAVVDAMETTDDEAGTPRNS